MPLDYDGGDKMNSDVSANALEHAASAKAATSFADEWKDEVRTHADICLMSRLPDLLTLVPLSFSRV